MVDRPAFWLSGCHGRWWYLAVVCWFSIVMATPKREDLSLWIDEGQVKSFIGVKMNIYVVKDGDVAPYLKNDGFADNLPSIPPHVDTVNLTWTAGTKHFTYWFTRLRSMDKRVLYDPLLSIPVSGIIPSKATIFQMAIPCTGYRRGVASLVIGLEIYNNIGTRIEGSPIKLKLKKHCRMHTGSRRCQAECQNGGRCNSFGECECKHSFYGKYCQIAMCFPACKNNGSCISMGQCSCRDGFEGQFCETVLCEKPCQNGGQCIKRGVCWCVQGFYGDTCQYSQCQKPCANDGTCVGPNKCHCRRGFKGDDCSLAVRCRKSCGSHGTCVEDNVCRCDAGWRGRHCHKRKRSGRGRRSHVRRKEARKGKTRRRSRKTTKWRLGRKKRRRLLKAVRNFSRRKSRRRRRGRRHRSLRKRYRFTK